MLPIVKEALSIAVAVELIINKITVRMNLSIITGKILAIIMVAKTMPVEDGKLNRNA
jgi:hypothetical protein